MAIIHPSADVTAAWNSRFSAHATAVLYKHSPTCGLSDIAYGEVQLFAAAHPDVPVYVVDVFALRALSNVVEATLDIRHESPQAIVFRDGAPVWHGSHRRVNARAMGEAVEAAAPAA